MNKIILGTVITYFLIIINGCNTVNKDAYSIDFIDYDIKYEIDIDNDGRSDSVKVFIDADNYIGLEVNNQKEIIGYSEEGVKSVLIHDNKGNYCVGIPIHYYNDTMISKFYGLNKDAIVYKSTVNGYVKSAYQNLGLYVKDRKYIIGFQNTTGRYLINPDLSLTLEGNYAVNDFKHTLIKELKAYKYNDQTDVYEIHTYQQGEVLDLYETDMRNLIYFKTKNGSKGYINLTKDDYDIPAGEFYIGDERLVDYFKALSLCDFMYIPVDKYPAFIRTIFFPDDKNITVKSMGNVCQVEDGIYFLYQGRLMHMDNEGKAVKEAYSNQQSILGIMKNNLDIFLCYENISALYKINENPNFSVEEVTQMVNGEGKALDERKKAYEKCCEKIKK